MVAGRATPLVLAAVSGGLYALALPPFGVSLLAWVAFAPLFVAIANVRPLPAFGLGMLWFFVASLSFASPMPHLISTYFDTPWVIGAAAFLGLTLFFGPLYGAYASWLAWLVPRGRGNPIVAASGLVAIEWARTSAGSIFGWAVLAHTQTPGATVLQSADLGGAYLPGFVLAATSFALASLATERLVPSRRGAWIAATIALVVVTLGYGAMRLREEPSGVPEIRVAIVQGGVAHAERWRADREQEHLEHYLALTLETELHEPDLVVWPEYAVSFNLREAGEERDALFEVSSNGGPELLFGAPFHRMQGIIQNSAFLLRDGQLAGRYDKNELLPFAERSPWPEITTLDREQYTPGGKAYPIATRDAEIGVFLCSEGLRPDLARRLTENGATVLANLSNDSWLGTEPAARMQLRSAALRAIENRRPLIRATGSGKSAFVTDRGQVTAESTFGHPDVIFGGVTPATQRTPYGRHGDLAALAASLIAVIASLLAAIRPRRSTSVHP